MKRQKSWAGTLLLLLFLPLPLLAQEGLSEEPKAGLSRDFSLSYRSSRTGPTIHSGMIFPAVASSGSQPIEKFTLKSLSRDFLKDAGQIWSYPAHIRTRDILPIAGVGVVTGLLIKNDEAIFRAVSNYRDNHAWVRSLSSAISVVGGLGAWVTTGAFLLVGLIAEDSKSVETAALSSSAMLQGFFVAAFVKGVSGRQRPLWAEGVDHWSGPVGFFKRFKPGLHAKYNSFPAGHAITAFSLATVVAMEYQKSVWVPILAYTTATGVGLSRVVLKEHWLSDVLVAGVLGHVIGRMVVLNHRHRYHNPAP